MEAYQVQGAQRRGWDYVVEFKGERYSLACEGFPSSWNGQPCEVFNNGEDLVWVDAEGRVLDADHRD